MKVLVISHMYPSPSNEMKGIFVHQQVKALEAKGVEIRVLSPIPYTPPLIARFVAKWRSYAAIPRQVWRDGIDVRHVRYLAFPRAWLFASSGRRMYRALRELLRSMHSEFPYDLIHAHVALPDGYAAMMFAQSLGKPFIVTIHGQDFADTIFRNSACHSAVHCTLSAASKVILVSHKLKHIGCKHFKAKFIVISNGIDPNDIVSGVFKYPDQYNYGDIGPRVISVSNLIKTKGIDFNLLAIRRLQAKFPRLRYVILGGGPEESRLRRFVKQLALEECVEFLGRVSHHTVMVHMAACDIFSLPSWSEGFGVVYLEAMASGKPVIGCQGEGIEDFVEHDKTGLLVKRQDVDSLVNALDFLLSHPNEAQVIGKRAREFVLENYTWEKNAEKTIKVYEEVLYSS